MVMGKKYEVGRKNIFQGFCICTNLAFSCIAFPRETLYSPRNGSQKYCFPPSKTPDKLRSLAKVQYCAPRRNVAFSCKSIVLLIVSHSPEKLCVHSKNICISLKKYCVLLQKYSVPLRNSAFTRQSIVLQRNFAFTYETFAFSWEMLCSLKLLHFLAKCLQENTMFLRGPQMFSKRMQTFSGEWKRFVNKCKVFQRNTFFCQLMQKHWKIDFALISTSLYGLHTLVTFWWLLNHCCLITRIHKYK